MKNKTMNGKSVAEAIEEANKLLAETNQVTTEQESKEDDAEGGYFDED